MRCVQGLNYNKVGVGETGKDLLIAIWGNFDIDESKSLQS